ncbi:MAG: glutamate synthase subunit alpha, partial [Actinomycetales bacterium]
MSRFSALPPAQGLYDPQNEHDACGVAFVATLSGIPSNEIVEHGLTALRNLDHRGAVGGEPDTGDGAGILMQVPDRFLREVARDEAGAELPEHGTYAAGMAFLPIDPAEAAEARATIERIATEEGLTVLGWRDVPVKPEILGSMSRGAMPSFALVFVTASGEPREGILLDRLAYCLRKRAEHEVGVYFPSLSCRTLIYKGMLTTEQLDEFFPDLRDPRMESALAIVHSRFSTNTFPSWPLAHPFRFVAHNGEINTARGNRNWMRAREATLSSELIPGDLQRLFPICDPEGSDTASLDEVLELLHLGGRELPHAVMMMIPEAWENNVEMEPARRAFYEFHSSIMEAWDGPACVCFTDGTQIGAVLDRNGLRPGRFWITDDGLVVLASEAGVLDLDPKTITRKGRLEPGRMFLLDLEQHRVVEDEEIKDRLAAEQPYDEWLYSGLVRFEDLPDLEHIVHTHASVARRQQVFGYTEEELRKLVAPIARTKAEAIGSMGTDTPIAGISDRPR